MQSFILAPQEFQLVGGKGMPPFGTVLERRDLNDLLAYPYSCRAKVNDHPR